MSFIQKEWVDSDASNFKEGESPAIDAENLNRIESGIVEALSIADDNKIVPIEHGGTGVATLDDAKKTLGISDFEWTTLGSISYNKTRSMQGSGNGYTETESLTIPCDENLLKECNFVKYVLKAGATFKADHNSNGKFSILNNRDTTILFIEDSSHVVNGFSISVTEDISRVCFADDEAYYIDIFSTGLQNRGEVKSTLNILKLRWYALGDATNRTDSFTIELQGRK